jgi:predicted N-acetyltransferase YhbS
MESLPIALTVRDARDDELDEVARILAAAFEATRPPPGTDHAAMYDRYLQDLANVRARRALSDLLVAVDGERLVGTGALYRPHRAVQAATASAGGPPPWPGDWASLRALAVDPAHHGRGVARMLIEARVARARELGAPVVGIHTHSPRVRAICERHGWQRAPAYDFDPHPNQHVYAYTLALA